MNKEKLTKKKLKRRGKKSKRVEGGEFLPEEASSGDLRTKEEVPGSIGEWNRLQREAGEDWDRRRAEERKADLEIREKRRLEGLSAGDPPRTWRRIHIHRYADNDDADH